MLFCAFIRIEILCEKLAKNAKARIGSFLNTDRSIKEMKEFYDEFMAE